MIEEPTVKPFEGDREIECAEAIEPAFRMLIKQAETAGWSQDEVLVALHELSANAFLFSEVTKQLH